MEIYGGGAGHTISKWRVLWSLSQEIFNSTAIRPLWNMCSSSLYAAIINGVNYNWPTFRYYNSVSQNNENCIGTGMSENISYRSDTCEQEFLLEQNKVIKTKSKKQTNWQFHKIVVKCQNVCFRLFVSFVITQLWFVLITIA